MTGSTHGTETQMPKLLLKQILAFPDCASQVRVSRLIHKINTV